MLFINCVYNNNILGSIVKAKNRFRYILYEGKI